LFDPSVTVNPLSSLKNKNVFAEYSVTFVLFVICYSCYFYFTVPVGFLPTKANCMANISSYLFSTSTAPLTSTSRFGI